MKTIFALSALFLLSACGSITGSGNAYTDYKMTSFSTVNSDVRIPGQYTSPHSF